jgi:Fur family ferric uptake transcriptional regulator
MFMALAFRVIRLSAPGHKPFLYYYRDAFGGRAGILANGRGSENRSHIRGLRAKTGEEGPRVVASERDIALLTTAYGAGRTSAQRLAIARAADAATGAFTVDDLAALTRGADPAIGTATVYRAVAAMAREGFLQPAGVRDGRALYVRCGDAGHHHHLVCTGCGAVAEAPCPLDTATFEAPGLGGFQITSHEVTLYGLCAECAGGAAGGGSDPGALGNAKGGRP